MAKYERNPATCTHETGCPDDPGGGSLVGKDGRCKACGSRRVFPSDNSHVVRWYYESDGPMSPHLPNTDTYRTHYLLGLMDDGGMIREDFPNKKAALGALKERT